MVQPHPATELSSNGVFTVVASPHAYTEAGVYTGTVTIGSDQGQHVARFTITVTD